MQRLLLLACACASASAAAVTSAVLELDDSTLDAAIDSTKGPTRGNTLSKAGVLLLELYKGRDDPIAAPFSKAAELLTDDGYTHVLARLDIATSKAELMGITTFPTILLFKGGENIEPCAAAYARPPHATSSWHKVDSRAGGRRRQAPTQRGSRGGRCSGARLVAWGAWWRSALRWAPAGLSPPARA